MLLCRHHMLSLPTGFIGYAPEMYALVSDHDVKDTDDDQLYYTLLYLDQKKRVGQLCHCRSTYMHGNMYFC